MREIVMRRLMQATLLLVFTVLSGCANLDGVRNFAKSQEKLAAYPELTQNFVETYQRQQAYLFDTTDPIPQENDQKRKAAQPDLLKIHATVSTYLKTLGQLAGETTFETHSADSAISTAVQEHPELGMNAVYVEALSKLSTLTTRWAIAQLQANAVRDMVRDGDESFQTILSGMKSIVRIYRKTAENEKRHFANFYEIELLTLDPAQNRMLISLARAHSQERMQTYDKVIGRCQALESTLDSMAAYHSFLANNSEAFTGAGAATTTTRLIHRATDAAGW